MDSLKKEEDSFHALRGGNPQQFLAVQISERCPDFHFISNRKSEQVVQKYVFTFSFSSKRKSSRPDFCKGVNIFVFDENQNLNTFSVFGEKRCLDFIFISPPPRTIVFCKIYTPAQRFAYKLGQVWVSRFAF